MVIDFYYDISCFLSLYKITNIVVVYLTNKYVIFVSIIIWAFVLAMIMDKIKEPKDNKAKKTWVFKSFLSYPSILG